MIDYLAAKADCVIRYQGGDNAGHTVINDLGKFAFHNFPSGICYKNIINIIGPGSVINVESYFHEKKELESKGLDVGNVMVSDRANLILPYHLLLERLEEERLKDKKYGSTMSGIAPVYSAKYLKKGLQAGELLHPNYLKEHLYDINEYYKIIIEKGYGAAAPTFAQVYDWLMTYGEILKPYLKDIQEKISELLANNKCILVEAQLGALRDITHGIYPYTTSTSTLAGYACASIPIPPASIESIMGITKAYSTCVGEGPFVTEITTPLADEMRTKAGEFGAKTGRPRRIGYFDAIATRYGAILQHATAMTITCLDVLSGYDELTICIGYDLNGSITRAFPLNANLVNALPVYETLPGWKEDISSIRTYEDLPTNAKRYIERIRQEIGVPVHFISVGPKREALIKI